MKRQSTFASGCDALFLSDCSLNLLRREEDGNVNLIENSLMGYRRYTELSLLSVMVQ